MSPARTLLSSLLLLSCALANGTQAQSNGDERYLGELRFAPEEEALFLERYELSVNRASAAQLYKPLEAIQGAPDWQPLPAVPAQERTISADALAEGEAYAGKNNSSALIVWRRGAVEAEYYFDGNERTSNLNSFSLAKPISALAVGRALMLGAIKSLDQPVADYVHEWREDPLRQQILVRHLLDMRPGFLRQASRAEPEDVMARSFLHPRSEEIIVREYPVVSKPGERYEYNNAASQMVGILIERATGRRYAEFIGTEILQKIGAQGGEVWVNREGGMANAGCCMLLPAETFLRLGILTLRDGVWNDDRLLPESYVEEMTQGTAANPYYGLGVYVAGRYTQRRGWGNPDLDLPKVLHSEPYLAADLYLFDGNMNQVVYMIPSQDLVILRTGGRPPRTDESEWDNAYLPNLIMRGIEGAAGTSKVQPR